VLSAAEAGLLARVDSRETLQQLHCVRFDRVDGSARGGAALASAVLQAQPMLGIIADDEPTRLFTRADRSPMTTPFAAASAFASPRIEVEVRSRTNGTRSFELPLGRYRVGKLDSCDIVIDDAWISREHLELNVSERDVCATDLGSTNGSYCNGARFRDRILETDTSIVIGRSTLRIRRTEPPFAVPVHRQRGGRRVGRIAFIMFVASLFTTIGVVTYPSMLDQVCEQYEGAGADAVRVVRDRARDAQHVIAELLEPM
jgi:hypothetical protein